MERRETVRVRYLVVMERDWIRPIINKEFPFVKSDDKVVLPLIIQLLYMPSSKYHSPMIPRLFPTTLVPLEFFNIKKKILVEVKKIAYSTLRCLTQKLSVFRYSLLLQYQNQQVYKSLLWWLKHLLPWYPDDRFQFDVNNPSLSKSKFK